MPAISELFIQSLEDVATRLRINAIRATTVAGSGHPSSSASAADLVAAIFFGAMRFDPEAPRSPSSDRFVLSKGHAAPLLYAAWAEVGRIDQNDLLALRKIDSDLEGHPTPRLPFVDVATGSLGQGLSIGVGLALGARFAGSDARVFVLLGDGETSEGSVWEAAQMAPHLGIGHLIAVVDVNGLGQSGPTMLQDDADGYQLRFAAFGWRAVVVDGHDIAAILKALKRARWGGQRPTAIIARTVKGKGIEGVEGLEGWHGRPLPHDDAERAISALVSRLHHAPTCEVQRPRAPRTRAPVAALSKEDAGGGPQAATQASPLEAVDRAPVATREAYGDALVQLGGENSRVVVLDGDVKNSTYAERFRDAYPDRYIEGFIAEQNMVSTAAGLAAEGCVPFVSTFACFMTRAADQIRMAGISRSPIKLCGSHAGVSIGEDGPSQMGLEDLALFRAVPECVVLYPADKASAHACVSLAAAHPGMVYLRTTRPKTPQIYSPEETFAVGGLKVLRQSDRDRATVVAAGITLHEALAAYDLLRQDGIAIRVIDLYSVKPLDDAALRAAAFETDHIIITVEDHYSEGGLGDAVLDAVAGSGILVFKFAVREIPRSGPPRKLLERYGIDRNAIAAQVRELAGLVQGAA